MPASTLFESLLSPPVLFFFLGMAATWTNSDLRLPTAISKFLAVYLLMSIGFRGGAELAHGGLHAHGVMVMAAAVGAAILTPVWCFFILRLRLDPTNAAAVAAAYGSISAVTFVTAVGCLQSLQIPFSGHMVAAMAMMESPAIVVGVLLARLYGRSAHEESSGDRFDWGKLLHEALLSGPVVLLTGSLLIGAATGDRGWQSVKPMLGDPFQGVLALFLLDMGLNAARRLRRLPESSGFLITFGVGAALLHAGLGIGLGALLDVSKGDALLLAVLCGSASYIAVPAAMRMALPKANPGLYVPMSLGVTFPFNVVIGIPLYLAAINLLW